MQLLNWATARGEKSSENVASFSDKSILSLRGHSDIVAYEFCPTVSLASNLVTRAGAYLLLAPFPTLCDARLDSGTRTQVDARQRASEFVGFTPWLATAAVAWGGRRRHAP